MMPRPGVDFPIDVALADSDRQAISNGITTVFHATTWSWEPGLRSGDNAQASARGDRAAAAASCRRHPLPSAARDLQSRCRGRDRPLARRGARRPARLQRPHGRDRRRHRQAAEAQPHGGAHADCRARISTRSSRASCRAPPTFRRRSRGSRSGTRAEVRMLSHDDETPGDAPGVSRAWASTLAEFPVNEETAREAADRRRRHRVRRAQRRARRQPHRLDQGRRHDREGPLLGAGIRLLLSGAAARGLPPCRRRRAAAYRGLEADLVGAGASRRPDRSRHARRGPARRHHAGRRQRCRCGRASSRSSPPASLVHLTDATRLLRASQPHRARLLRRHEFGPILRAMASFPRYAIYFAAGADSALSTLRRRFAWL